MRPPVVTSRLALSLLAGVLVLSGCGSDDPDTDPQAAPDSPAASAAPTAPVVPSVEPSPSPTGPDRSPEALAALLQFTAPEFEEPPVQEAVDGYREFLTQLVVAQGIADANYPPLLAAVDPAFADAALDNTRQAARDGYFYAGPYVEEVVDAAGASGQVIITSCADLSTRKIYRVDSGEFVQDSDALLTPVIVTMTRGASQWVLSQYQRSEDRVCS